MKTIVLSVHINLKMAVLVFLTALNISARAQTSNELVFQNSSLETGSAGANGAVYRFPNVSATMDALVTITGRSSSSVALSNIDITNDGFGKAFQPQINRGNVNGATSWWMEFEIKFVYSGTTQSANVSEAYVTGLDIDGNSSNLREWDAFYGSTSYTVENNSLLTMTTVTGILANTNLLGRQFTGPVTTYSGIDTSATQLMTTHRYLNRNTITVRLGATTTGASSSTNRLYSLWFKNFTYSSPLSTLPVKLASFTATLNNNKADLKWTTSSEINVSHFVIQKSFDGINYSDAGIMFAYGSETEKANYQFPDNLATVSASVVYYRLRSVDHDGKSELSEVRIVRLASQQNNDITILTYPNPVTTELRITVPANWQNKPVVYEVFNANGQTVKRIQTGSSSQTETINFATLARGLYIVKVTCEGNSGQQRIVKQ